MGNFKPCPVARELFEEVCWKCALFLFEDDWEWRDKYEDEKDLGFNMYPDMAAAYCQLSPPTFRKRARQFLWPEKFGSLPDGFFEPEEKEEEETEEEKEYSGSETYRLTRQMIDYELKIEELPKLGGGE